MTEIEGFILCGGQSSRMGTDKARLRLGEQTFVERIAAALKIIAVRTSLVNSFENDAGALWSLPTVNDVYPQWGALGGLHAALAACRAEWCAVVACDLPFVTGELFMRLASLTQHNDAVVPIQPDARPQPLCALYRTAPCLESATELINAGERRPRALLQTVNTRWVADDELSNLQGATHFFTNINTPEDYAQANERMRDEGRRGCRV
jgi:molybdopterin-guanine dinucleotide biosynthesis protein A